MFCERPTKEIFFPQNRNNLATLISLPLERPPLPPKFQSQICYDHGCYAALKNLSNLVHYPLSAESTNRCQKPKQNDYITLQAFEYRFHMFMRSGARLVSFPSSPQHLEACSGWGGTFCCGTGMHLNRGDKAGHGEAMLI